MLQEQINCQRRVHLDQHSIFRVAGKALDTKVLFDLFEKQLDLPALAIDIGNGLGAKPEVIGQKLVSLAAFWVAIADTPQARGFLSLMTSMMWSEVTPVLRSTGQRSRSL